MKFVLFAVLLLLSGVVAAQDSPTDVAQQAAILYERGDHAAALGLYETLADAGIHDSAVYFNMGQAYFAAQDSGRALLQYRRSQQIAPRDTELNLALARIRSSRQDIQGDDVALIDSLAALTLPLMTLDELNWLAFVLWSACFVTAGVYVTQARWRNAARVALFALSILLVLGFALWFSRIYTSAFRPAAVVTAEVAQVMSGPGEDYLEIYQLHAAAEIRILEDRGDWAHFVLPDGREGWLASGAFEKV
jgi:tetratricopeptide (TPR) repeat protein